MATSYNSVQELKDDNEYQTDYNVLIGPSQSSVIVMAIHGGGIEPGCTELALETAKLSTCSYYCFEGCRPSRNYDLHVSSVNFDDPPALSMVAKHKYTLTYHGYDETRVKHTQVGGADLKLRKKVRDALVVAGFSAGIVSDNSPIAGINPKNITNKNERGMGVQLEISTAQRDAFFTTNTSKKRRNTQTKEFYDYVHAISETLKNLDSYHNRTTG